ncbi:SH3 domain-containing protein [Acinetobacter baumannii]|uniref:SH3 domain-containing protein n=1 Tax=Acinetobacter baumannii TaxID=470 RepID=A0A7S8ZSU8_ACIBA|nr:SH3 domain-containing protein [Acinetobacter baumannii]MDO7386600.1 SH3 domain-containing protein [Acinetobacter baumannii]MDO7419340.1 SH3 domain-containing protein [Acinetobacter baumannii]QPF12100.1 SH3 domain-containing protein [Acinetobacter baumannii]SSR34980.1 SH3 domain-containing protein [Acinetobacter baumannii]HCE0435153.1 SH3 domain-containing protein [Acinetobacter baumannii]
MKKSTLGWGAAGLVALGIFGSGNDNSPKQTSDSENAQSAVEEVIESKYINTNSLNIRDKPNGHVVGKLGRGEKVDIYETKGNWARISLNSSSPQWLSTKLLCERDGCFKQKSRSTTSNNYQALKSHPHHSERKQKKTYYDSDCSCAVVDYCVGPRGGHYCITSGGNKRYKPRY